MRNLNNSVQLIGNLGNDPKTTEFESGKSVTTFSLATNKKYKDAKGNEVKQVQWHNIVLWGKGGEIVEKFNKKGDEIMVEGELTYREYEDESGAKKFITEIIVNDFRFLSNKKEK